MKFATKEYQDWLIGEMRPDEKVPGKGKGQDKPKAQGLLDVCVREIGAVEVLSEIITSPCSSDVNSTTMLSTVKTTVILHPYEDSIFPMKVGGPFKFEATSTQGAHNNPDFFFFCTETAETISLGRALKRALALNIHTAEEVAKDLNELKESAVMARLQNANTSSQSMTPAQRKLILGQSQDINLDLEKLLSEYSYETSQVSDLTIPKDTAAEILGKLADWKNKKLPKKYMLKEKEGV